MARRTFAVVAWAAVALACGIFFCTGCGKAGDGSSAGGTSDASSGGGSGSAAVDGEGRAVAAMGEELGRHWLQTPEGWISEYPARIRIATGERDGPESFYRQIKELKFDVASGALSESDQLNGTTFRGYCHFHSSPMRIYGDPNAFGPPRWSDWSASRESVRVEQRNGKWTFSGLGYMVRGTKPSPATVAQLK